MELLSPAGTLEKLRYAYAYGADAAYMGMHNFSLRTKAGNIGPDDIAQLKRIKGEKKLYVALNAYMHQMDIELLKTKLDEIKAYPFDAFIVSDLGAAEVLKQHFGNELTLHLSTQANCLNSSAVKAYQSLGFKRIILGRETPLDEIKKIKDANPTVELEVFVHGAMCMAYSGRCFLSAFMADRSANQGDCAHSCRWNYRLLERDVVLEEEKRPGEYYPIYEGDGYTTILSSKDLCMIDHLAELKAAGIDSLKIEGRMKSLYYVATTTRAYRKAIDAVLGKKGTEDWPLYRDELFRVSHREFSTGFFFDSQEIDMPTQTSYVRDYLLVGTIGTQVEKNTYQLFLKNKISTSQMIEYIGPTVLSIADDSFELIDEEGVLLQEANHHQKVLIRTTVPLSEGFIVRRAQKA